VERATFAPPVSKSREDIKRSITAEFVERVRACLPGQPWKPGLDREVSERLGCSREEYFVAVDQLIEDGVFLRQRDGVLYDLDGNVVDFDRDRVDPDSLELLDPHI